MHAEVFTDALEALFAIFDVIIDVVAQALAPVFDLIGYYLGLLAVWWTVLAGVLAVVINLIQYSIESLTGGAVSLKRVKLDFDFRTEQEKKDQREKDKEDEVDKDIREIKLNTDRLLELENQFLRASLNQQFAINELQRVFEGRDAAIILEIPNLQEQRQLIEDQHQRDREKAQRELDENLKKKKLQKRNEDLLKKEEEIPNMWLEVMEDVADKFNKISDSVDNVDDINAQSTSRKIVGGLIQVAAIGAGAYFGGWGGAAVGGLVGGTVNALLPNWQRRAPIQNTLAYAPPPGFEGLTLAPTPQINTPEVASQYTYGSSPGPGSEPRSNVSGGAGGGSNVNVMVTIDREAMEMYLSSSHGEQMTLNHIRINSDDVREMVS